MKIKKIINTKPNTIMGNNNSVPETKHRFFKPNEERIYNAAVKKLELIDSNCIIFVNSRRKREEILNMKILLEQIKFISGEQPPEVEDVLPPPLYSDTVKQEKIDITEFGKHDDLFMEYILRCVLYLNRFCSKVFY